MSRKNVPELHFGKRLVQAREILGLTQSEMAKKLDISHAHVSKLESGGSRASFHLLLAIEYLFGISASWLQTGEGEMKVARLDLGTMPTPELKVVADSPPKAAEQNIYVSMPIFEDSAAAGVPRIVRDEAVEGYAVVHASQLQRGRHIALRVSGDSMKPIIDTGDIVAVNRDRRDPRQLLGRIVVAQVDEGITIKYLLRGKPGTYILQPENREYRTIDVNATDLKVIGCVEWAWKKLG